MIEYLRDTFHRLIDELNLDTYRYLYPEFNIDRRLTGLIGPRGVGKTTLLLQFIKNHLYKQREAFYFSADHIAFSKITILEFVTDLYQKEGIKIFFIDEIHKYANWQQEIKNLYDSFPSIKIIFSGSSSMDLIKGSYDLSRRLVTFDLHGLSFREYLNFKTNQTIEKIPLEKLLLQYSDFDNKLAQIPKIKGHFEDYLSKGYYPFVFEDPETYYEKIERIIEKTIHEDIANYYNLKTPNLIYFKKILSFLSSIPPGEVNTSSLAKGLSIDSKTTLHYLNILEECGLVHLVSPYQGGNHSLRKSQKIFLNNTSLLNAINCSQGMPVHVGTQRELFFLQMMTNTGNTLYFSREGDFQTKHQIFEIGGKNKTFEQIKDTKKPAFLVKDDILTSSKNVIPLYYFGFIY